MTDLRNAGRYFILMMAIAFASHAARAEVTGIEIASRSDVLAGKSFGDAGSYEKIIGKVHFAIDPASPANRRIVDIDKAPRDSAGRVRFSADLYALVPKESARGNGAVLFDVLNRGRKNMLVTFNRAPARRSDRGSRFRRRLPDAPGLHFGVGRLAVRYPQPRWIDGTGCATGHGGRPSRRRPGDDVVRAQHARPEPCAGGPRPLRGHKPLSADRPCWHRQHADRTRRFSRSSTHASRRSLVIRPNRTRTRHRRAGGPGTQGRL